MDIYTGVSLSVVIGLIMLVEYIRFKRISRYALFHYMVKDALDLHEMTATEIAGYCQKHFPQWFEPNKDRLATMLDVLEKRKAIVSWIASTHAGEQRVYGRAFPAQQG